MAKDKIWLISVVVCFLAAAVNLAGTAVGMPDALTRIAGAVNLISLAVVVYRTVYLGIAQQTKNITNSTCRA